MINPSHTFNGMLSLIKSDISRYKATGAKNVFKIIFLTQTFWATSVFRIYTYLYAKTAKHKVLRMPVAILYHLNIKLVQIMTSISLPVGANIGKGLYLAHFGPIIVTAGAHLGDNCNLGNQVVIGFGRVNGNPGFPELGNRVFVGPGAKIFGPVKIGDDASIGSNAVVTHDVPARATVVGIPAKVINYHGSFKYVFYKGMDVDPDRIQSLKIASDLDPTILETDSFLPGDGKDGI